MSEDDLMMQTLCKNKCCTGLSSKKDRMIQMICKIYLSQLYKAFVTASISALMWDLLNLNSTQVLQLSLTLIKSSEISLKILIFCFYQSVSNNIIGWIHQRVQYNLHLRIIRSICSVSTSCGRRMSISKGFGNLRSNKIQN